jgi:chromate transporter
MVNGSLCVNPQEKFNNIVKTPLKELSKLFLKLGATAFGGPAAHIAMIEEEVVKRRNWLTHEQFLDLLGATNLIPGPNSTEMAIHIGYQRAGWKGVIVSGVCFIFPAILITLLLAYLYTTYGTTPQFEPIIYGIRPAIIAVILSAVYRLTKSAYFSASGRNVGFKNPFMAILFIAVAILHFFGIDEILLLLSAGILGLLWKNRDNIRGGMSAAMMVLPLTGHSLTAGSAVMAAPASFLGLGLFFLKIGSILYGSGYVLVAYLQSGLVESRHWLTQTQLFDAIAAGQFTPGPVLSTATFIGYIIFGIPGSIIATTGIFLPSFIFVLLSSPFIPRLRKSPYASGFLDGVNAASLGLMLAVTIALSVSALTNITGWTIFLIAFAFVVWKNINAAWIVLGSAVLGWMLTHV